MQRYSFSAFSIKLSTQECHRNLTRFNYSKLNSFNNFDINVFSFLIMMLDTSKRRITLILIFLVKCLNKQLTNDEVVSSKWPNGKMGNDDAQTTSFPGPPIFLIRDRTLGTRLGNRPIRSLLANRPFPSCFEPHYESDSKWKVFVMKISFHSYANKTNFQMKSFALSLAFIVRFIATRK